MDILQHQAYELCRLNWGSNLRIETAERPRRLIVHYWTQAQGATGASHKVDGPAAGGSVQITIVDLPDRTGASKTLAKLFDDDDDDDDDDAAQTEGRATLMTVKRRGLQITWDAHSSILADSETSDLAISPHSLDIEALLSLVVKRHTLSLLRSLQRRILVSDHPVSRLLRPEDCTLCTEHAQRQGDEFSTGTEATSFSFLQVELHGSNRQRATSPSRAPFPPCLLFAATFTASILTTRPTYARLAEASDRINNSVDSLFDVLYRLEVFARVEDWERMASYLGFRAVRKLNLRPQDLAKFGPTASPEAAPQLFIPLRDSFPGYFLALQPSELAGASIALVYVVQVMEPTGAPSLTVQSIEWLDRAKIASSAKLDTMLRETTQYRPESGKQELTMEELAQVHSYCLALVSYFRVEQQLRMRGIPYLHLNGAKAHAVNEGTQADARDNGLFDDEDAEGAAAAIEAAPENEADQTHQQDSDSSVAALVPTFDRSCVQMLIKLRMKSRRFRALHKIVAYATTSDQHSTSPATWIDFDDETSLLTLSTRDLDNCIPIFYTQWERVMRMVQLTREVLNASRAWQQRALRCRISCKKPSDLVELRRFDFDMVIFSYGTITVDDVERKLLVRVRWQDAKMEMTPYNNLPITQSGGYILEFGSVPALEVESVDKVSIHATSVLSAQQAAPKEDTVSKWFEDVHASVNPHNTMAFELRRTVNVAARSAAMSAMAHPQLERMVWKGFFKLLQDTLPLVEIKGATWFRLRFQDCYALDIRLATQSRLIVSDASRSLFRSELQESSSDPNVDTSLDSSTNSSNSSFFAGSDLLNSLIEGKSSSAIDSAAHSSSKPRSALDIDNPSAASQFQPIPNIDSVLRKVHAGLRSDDQTGQRVWDLRRALLVSTAAGSPLLPKIGDDGLLEKLLPQLIELVSAEIQGGAAHQS
ncbi:related to RNA polymerase II mediator complex protein pmc1 [Ustilago trichophora]|uniref:Related to RNA polymerase II mediator complex protein pmc1 n=1 Tax=Ustilago trichophora TaxID=86804 RepID=A0A5C3E5V2_9BASI|nr:related to RNA polymerase II mediator complex protein pmc1 [Ustilago trichophora]